MVVVVGLMFVPLPVVVIPFNVKLPAFNTTQANWLDCPGVMTEGEAVKAEITGAVWAAGTSPTADGTADTGGLDAALSPAPLTAVTMK